MFNEMPTEQERQSVVEVVPKGLGRYARARPRALRLLRPHILPIINSLLHLVCGSPIAFPHRHSPLFTRNYHPLTPSHILLGEVILRTALGDIDTKLSPVEP